MVGMQRIALRRHTTQTENFLYKLTLTFLNKASG
jgi:hypothetical protein